MLGPNSRTPALIALVGGLFGILFAGYSAFDYADHLDRALHDIHCSYIPGASPTTEAEACRAAMYSAYGAVFREQTWGGLPVGLFALGAFSFFTGFAAYLATAGEKASGKAVGFFAIVGQTPLLVSVMMFVISILELGTVCRTCVGIYGASTLLSLGSLLGLATLRQTPELYGRLPRPKGAWGIAILWLIGLGGAALVPSLVYAASAPDHRPYLTQCGQIKAVGSGNKDLLHFRTARSIQPTLLFEDPLFATCKAFHERLESEGVMQRLDVTLALFPLDSSCNWMLDRALHPGACLVSKAVLCGKGRAAQVLQWAYDEQAYLLRAGKAGDGTGRAVIQKRWGEQMLQCVDSRDATAMLNANLHFAAENGIPVSTPQMYLGKQRVCDEDTDIGLRYTLKQLAPEVLR